MPEQCYLFRQEHIPAKAAFPAVDAHNHLWGRGDPDAIVPILDSVGVVCLSDLTANAKVAWIEGGYSVQPAAIEDFLTTCVQRYPGRFYGFTMGTFARPTTEPLFDDASRFVDETVAMLRSHVALGARGLKVLKELGLAFHTAGGELIAVDDLRLAGIWDEAGRLGVPVLIHQSDPYGFFQPPTPENEHYESLRKYPSWCFSGDQFPGKEELLERRDRLVARHSETTFILPHVANFAENLGYVSRLLDEHPNVYIDFSARIDELGRQPYTAREFFLRYQDRILFGTDMPVSEAMYRCYFRFLETFDEHFFTPDYDGTFDRHRWAICGIGLPPDVLAKIYFHNAVKVIPGLKEDLAAVAETVPSCKETAS